MDFKLGAEEPLTVWQFFASPSPLPDRTFDFTVRKVACVKIDYEVYEAWIYKGSHRKVALKLTAKTKAEFDSIDMKKLKEDVVVVMSSLRSKDFELIYSCHDKNKCDNAICIRLPFVSTDREFYSLTKPIPGSNDVCNKFFPKKEKTISWVFFNLKYKFIHLFDLIIREFKKILRVK